jgi:hypothetical protein
VDQHRQRLAGLAVADQSHHLQQRLHLDTQSQSSSVIEPDPDLPGSEINCLNGAGSGF